MKATLKTFAIATATTAATTIAAFAEPVYMMAHFQIEDQEKYFNEYGAAVFPIVMGTGAKVLVASPTVNTLEGEWAGNWTVVIEFPSEEAALYGWYNSEAYVDVRELRFATTSVNNIVIAPGFVQPARFVAQVG